MTNNIPVTSQEIKDVAQYITNLSLEEQSKRVSPLNYALLQILADKEWVNAKENIDELRDRALNRIRFYMVQFLADKGIEIEWNGDEYTFIVNDFKPKTPVKKERKDMEELSTFTKFETKYIPHREFDNIIKSLQFGEKPLIVGPKGCGKSRCLEEAASRLNLKCIRIALGQVAEPSDLIGTKEIIEENGVPITRFVPGLLTEAAINGTMVILDEMDSVQPQVGLALHAVLEATNNIVCPTEKGTEIIKVNPNFRIGATANSWGYGDETGHYAGVEIQNRATWDRLHPKINMDYDPEMEQIILKSILNGDEFENEIIQILYDNTNGLITKIRAAIASEDIHDECSIRTVMAFAKHYKIFGYHNAMYYMINEFKPEYREQLKEMLITSWGPEATASVNDYDSSKPAYIDDDIKKKFKDTLMEIRNNK